MAKNEHEVLFLTLNYDTLLERDLLAFKRSVYSFDKIDDYINQERHAKVVKVHGSSNWFRPLHALNKRHSDGFDWTSVLDNYGLRLMDNSIHIAPDSKTLTKDLGAKNFPSMDTAWGTMPVYPVLTAPLAEKGESDLVCPEPHTKFAMNFMSKCPKFLVIGTSGNDADLFSLISRSAPQPQMVHFVNADLASARNLAQRYESAIENFGAGASVHSHGSGFGDYLASENFRQLVRG